MLKGVFVASKLLVSVCIENFASHARVNTTTHTHSPSVFTQFDGSEFSVLHILTMNFKDVNQDAIQIKLKVRHELAVLSLLFAWIDLSSLYRVCFLPYFHVTCQREIDNCADIPIKWEFATTGVFCCKAASFVVSRPQIGHKLCSELLAVSSEAHKHRKFDWCIFSMHLKDQV